MLFPVSNAPAITDGKLGEKFHGALGASDVHLHRGIRHEAPRAYRHEELGMKLSTNKLADHLSLDKVRRALAMP
jgi:hypothetical protein